MPPRSEAAGPPRVLFITATRIGDAVLSTGVLAHGIEQWPDARFTIACGPVAAPLFEAVPRLDRVIVLRKRPWRRHWLDLWQATRRQRWDAIIDLRASGIGLFLRARRRFLLSPIKTDDHRVRRNARVIGVDPPPPPRIFTTPESRARAAALLPRSGLALALGPTANWHGKEWPATSFAALVEAMSRPGMPFAEAPLVVLGGPGEERAAAPLLAALPAARTLDLVGRIDLLTAHDLLARVRLYIGNDSGLMHLAAAAGAPTLGLFGPSREALYAPWGERSATLRGAPYEAIVDAPDYDPFAPVSYMTAIPVPAAVEAALALYRRTAGPSQHSEGRTSA